MGYLIAVLKEFGADEELKTLYRLYLAFVLFLVFLWWLIPVVAIVAFMPELQIDIILSLVVIASFFVVAGFALYWIQRFHSSINYVLDDYEIIVTKGVWWKTKNIVPYNRITNIHVHQGPISRYLGLARLAIQTAGFSSAGGGNVQTAEAVILGIKDYEEIKDFIMEFVRERKPKAIEAETEVSPSRDMNQQILSELQKIRKALEK